MSSPNDPQTDALTTAQALTGGKGRPRSVDRETVIAAAQALLDEEGLGAVTIRRVAERVGVGVATIYNAAGTKQDILLAVIDEVLSDLPHVADAADPWDGLCDVWTAVHELLYAHPAVAQLAALQPVRGTGVQRLVTATVELLGSVGLDEAAAYSGYFTLRSYTLGFTLLQISRSPDDDANLPHATSSTFEFEQGLDILLRGLRDIAAQPR